MPAKKRTTKSSPKNPTKLNAKNSTKSQPKSGAKTKGRPMKVTARAMTAAPKLKPFTKATSKTTTKPQPKPASKVASKPAVKAKAATATKLKVAPASKAKSTTVAKSSTKPVATKVAAKSATATKNVKTAPAKQQAAAKTTNTSRAANTNTNTNTNKAGKQPKATASATTTTASANGPWPGRFVWHDLMTTDATASQRFYCELFGWQVHEVDMQGSTYRMLMVGPGPIGGIVEEKNIPVSHWMPYVAVDDVDATAKQITQRKGSVCCGPMDIPNTGRFAVVGDPLGAYFSIYKGLPESPGADPNVPVAGRVCWNELLTTDAAAAQSFYTAIFGWQPQAKDMGPMGTYRVQTLAGAQVGGIMQNPQNGAPSAWLMYFLVTDLKSATEKAKQLGATALVENTPIPELGSFSMLQDPVGAVFAMFQPNVNMQC